MVLSLPVMSPLLPSESHMLTHLSRLSDALRERSEHQAFGMADAL